MFELGDVLGGGRVEAVQPENLMARQPSEGRVREASAKKEGPKGAGGRPGRQRCPVQV